MNLTSNSLWIQLNFEDPAQISVTSEKDLLFIQFMKGAKLLNSETDENSLFNLIASGELKESDVLLAPEYSITATLT